MYVTVSEKLIQSTLKTAEKLFTNYNNACDDVTKKNSRKRTAKFVKKKFTKVWQTISKLSGLSMKFITTMLHGMAGGDAVHVRGTMCMKGKGEPVGMTTGTEKSVFVDAFKDQHELARLYTLVCLTSDFTSIRIPIALVPSNKAASGEVRTLHGILYHTKALLFMFSGIDVKDLVTAYCGDHATINPLVQKNENYGNYGTDTSMPTVHWNGSNDDVYIPTDTKNKEIHEKFLAEHEISVLDPEGAEATHVKVEVKRDTIHPFVSGSDSSVSNAATSTIDWNITCLNDVLPNLVSKEADAIIDKIPVNMTVDEQLTATGKALMGAVYHWKWVEDTEETEDVKDMEDVVSKETKETKETTGTNNTSESESESESEKDEKPIEDWKHDGSKLTEDIVDLLKYKDDLITALQMLGVQHSKYTTMQSRRDKLKDIIKNKDMAPSLGPLGRARANIYEYLTKNAKSDGNSHDGSDSTISIATHWLDFVCCSPHLGKALHNLMIRAKPKWPVLFIVDEKDPLVIELRALIDTEEKQHLKQKEESFLENAMQKQAAKTKSRSGRHINSTKKVIDANPTLGMDENQLLKMFMGKFNKMNEEVSFARYFIYYIFIVCVVF